MKRPKDRDPGKELQRSTDTKAEIVGWKAAGRLGARRKLGNRTPTPKLSLAGGEFSLIEGGGGQGERWEGEAILGTECSTSPWSWELCPIQWWPAPGLQT